MRARSTANSGNGTEQTIGQRTRPKVAVVLGSGGIRAFAAIPLFEFLDRQGIEVDLLVGSSGGSLLCAGRAAGYSTDEMRGLTGIWNRKYTSQVDYRGLLEIAHPRLTRAGKPGAILKPERIRQLLQRLFQDRRIEDLKTKTRLLATDARTGDPVVLSEGLLHEAVYASSACFPLLPPTRIGGRWLIDGAFSAPLPVMEAVKRGMDVIIAVDFSQQVTSEPAGFLDFFNRSMGAMSRSLARSQMTLAIELHHHEIVRVDMQFDEAVGLWDARQTAGILEAGERSIEHKKHEILSAIQSFSGPEALRS